MLRTCLIILLGLFATTSIAVAETAPLDLNQLIDEALANNPSLTVIDARFEAMRERIPQAGALADPMLRFDLSNIPTSGLDFDSTPMTGKQLLLSQRFPWWGKLAARERMAIHEAGAVEAMYDDRALTVTNMVRQAYYSLAFVDRATKITIENRQLLGDFIRIAQTKYVVGSGLQQDVLRAQVAQSGLDDHLIILRQQRERLEAHLNTVLNRQPQTPVGPTGEVALTPFDLSPDSLQKMAVESRPALRAIKEVRQRWEEAGVLADRERRPDIEVIAGYRQRAFIKTDPVRGSDFVTLGIRLNLPIYQDRKQDRQEAEARAQVRASTAELEDLTQQIYGSIGRLYADARAHRDREHLLRTAIIPQADQSLTSSLAGYQVDKVDFLTLLDAQVTLFDYEIDLYRHVTEFEKALAELEAVVGRRLF